MLKFRFLLLYFITYQVSAQISDFEHIDFNKADNTAALYDEASLNNLAELSQNLTRDLVTDVEKFRAIYMWVCTNIANDYRLYNKNMHKRYRYRNDSIKLKNWNEKFKEIAFQKLLKRKTTICTGYAYILAELSKLAGINCKIVHGYAKTSTIDIDRLDFPNHSWNAVQLNNKWYLCDPTWASGSQDAHTGRFKFNFIEGYFLANPKLFAINHYPIEKQWLLFDSTDYTFEDFIDSPILYTKTYTYIDNHISPKKLDNEILKYQEVKFEYVLHNTDKNSEIKLVADNGYSSKTIKPEITLNNSLLEFSHTFNKTGFYDLHVYIKDDIVATYTFDVRKN